MNSNLWGVFFVLVFFAGLRRLAGIVNGGMIGDHRKVGVNGLGEG